MPGNELCATGPAASTRKPHALKIRHFGEKLAGEVRLRGLNRHARAAYVQCTFFGLQRRASGAI